MGAQLNPTGTRNGTSTGPDAGRRGPKPSHSAAPRPEYGPRVCRAAIQSEPTAAAVSTWEGNLGRPWGTTGQLWTVMPTPELATLPTELEARDTKVYVPLGTVVVFQPHNHP